MVQPCRKAVSEKVAYDDHGACYSFMALDSGGVRERYRFTPTCASKYATFEHTAGMCKISKGWDNELGTPIEPLPPASKCALNITKDRCDAASCLWNDKPSVLSCNEWPGNDGVTEGIDGKVCKVLCEQIGGAFKNDKCSLPSCIDGSYS